MEIDDIFDIINMAQTLYNIDQKNTIYYKGLKFEITSKNIPSYVNTTQHSIVSHDINLPTITDRYKIWESNEDPICYGLLSCYPNPSYYTHTIHIISCGNNTILGSYKKEEVVA